jgi:hypothetical protein
MKNVLRAFTIACLVASVACTGRVDLEKVPVGARVAVTRQDGGVVSGTLAARDDTSVTVAVGPERRIVPRDQIVGVQVVEEVPAAAAAPAAPPEVVFRTVTLPAGSVLVVRLDSPVGSASSRQGDPVTATLTEAVTVDGADVLPRGSLVTGDVASVRTAGRVRGRASIAVVFRQVTFPGRGDRQAIEASVSRTASSTKGADTATIAFPALGGAIVGGLVGGKKGALLGTAIGGGAGTAVVLSTRGHQISLPRGTVLSIRLQRPIDVRVPVASR